MTAIERWISRAERIRDGDGYTYAALARDMVDALGWTAAADVACAVRSHVYGSPGGHPLQAAVKPLYDRLGWQQAALFACWFRDAHNRPDTRPGRRPAAGHPSSIAGAGAQPEGEAPWRTRKPPSSSCRP